ncbi:DUF2284 domain-containing protein [Candidatus Formimonas warabiya]|uniref:Metal-binding protein n=1 Tax=Formimonas warabiya TaxID=1761012 RepID=A0A3G1KMZ7_FORW1|nr:DUF2284 domain-containing protein [Candidatus Formimonas warabiya]ATW23833.1 metal-binding protein [Candidatus Formimonas warabiya]
MKSLPDLNPDPQGINPQYLENLATAYWFSQVLFTAVERDLFSRLAPEGKKLEELADLLHLNREGLQRFLHALCVMGLICCAEGIYFNTKLARKYLVRGEEDYQGDGILWRKDLAENWQELGRCLEKGTGFVFPDQDEREEDLNRGFHRYCRAMDCMIKNKAREILPLFSQVTLAGEILDVGSGAGSLSAAFLKAFSQVKATLVDMPQVMDYARRLNGEQEYGARMTYIPANILDPWAAEKEHFELVILSNIVHAYAEAEITQLLDKATACLAPDGMILIHDFFFEYDPERSALADLNLFINTFHGRVYPARWLQEQLIQRGLTVTELLPLNSDTALVIGARNPQRLEDLCLDGREQLASKIARMGFRRVLPVSPEMIHVPGWVDLHCQFGCSSFGKPHCPPNSLAPEKTREMLKDYRHGFILEGAPPTRDFQHLVLEAEHEAFKAGYYKAFALWAGPCSLCTSCTEEGRCKNTKNARPSMEASGIDVFETMRRAGIALRTLAEGDDFVKYFAILLLE